MPKNMIRNEVNLPSGALIFLFAVTFIIVGILGWNVLGATASSVLILIGGIVVAIFILRLLFD